MSQLITNKIQTPDGTILQSFHRHDYKEHLDADGTLYATDGGTSYQRVLGNLGKVKILSLTVDSPFEEIREEFTWGTYGKYGNDPYTCIKLSEMSNDHIKAILITQDISEWLSELFYKELDYRSKNNIIKD